MTTVIDLEREREARFRPRKLHPDRDRLPRLLLADILDSYPDLLPGRDGWIAGDKAGFLLNVHVWETRRGVYDWQTTYAHPHLSPGAA